MASLTRWLNRMFGKLPRGTHAGTFYNAYYKNGGLR